MPSKGSLLCSLPISPIPPYQPAAAGAGTGSGPWLRHLPALGLCQHCPNHTASVLQTAEIKSLHPQKHRQPSREVTAKLLLSTPWLWGHILDPLLYAPHSRGFTTHSRSGFNWSRALFFRGDFWQAGWFILVWDHLADNANATVVI